MIDTANPEFRAGIIWIQVLRQRYSGWRDVKLTPKRWNMLRAFYNEITPLILAGAWRDPYFLDWDGVFTPIERALWHSIRYIGLPFFPQYPVGRFFVDFADPAMSIALECDGKQWHDAERDKQRDAEIATLGWRVIRFTGRQCLMADGEESAHAALIRLGEGYYFQNWSEDAAA